MGMPMEWLYWPSSLGLVIILSHYLCAVWSSAARLTLGNLMQTHMSLCTCEYVHCFVKLNMFQGKSNSEIYTPTGKGSSWGCQFWRIPPTASSKCGKENNISSLVLGSKLSSRKANHWMKQVIPHRQVYQRKRVPPSVPNLFGHSSLFEVNNFIVPWYSPICLGGETSQTSHRPSWEWLWCRSPVLRWTPFHRIHTDHIPNPKCWLCHVISSWQYAWYIYIYRLNPKCSWLSHVISSVW